MAVMDIDIGNTRAKWRCGEQRGALVNGGDWEDSFSGLVEGPERVRVANVAGKDIESGLAQWVMNRWGLELELAVTNSHAAGVQCGYPDPGQLGVDRWLAVLAASRESSGDTVIVSAGSAITVDLLNERRQHLGGFIVPGLEMQRRALFSGTSQVKVESLWKNAITDPGSSTAQAVINGCLKMAIQLIQCARQELNSSAPVFLGGGDAQYLLPHLNGQVFLKEEMVLDGLSVLMP
ncbi:type III pantothenate kinase [bacterium SCSIO 12696]|nr:type III pantothenate kinase [bacterium SCSIO 12696]